MNILLIKMSSMGDIFHSYPAITDLKRRHPEVNIHWVVEESFAEIASWHPGVTRVIPIGARRWTKNKSLRNLREALKWIRELRRTRYDMVIDAQGIFKSVVVAMLARKGAVHGYDEDSIRRAPSSRFYNVRHHTGKTGHAVEQVRQLFASVFGYSLAEKFSFGVGYHFEQIEKRAGKVVFIVGTTWKSKMWATAHWKTLAGLALDEGCEVEVIWGNESERAVADAIIAAHPAVTRSEERLSIREVAEKLVEASGVVGLDTGFSHLSGALETPTVALYGPTSPERLGLIGDHARNLGPQVPLPCVPCHGRTCRLLPAGSNDAPPCLTSISPDLVWRELRAKTLVAG